MEPCRVAGAFLLVAVSTMARAQGPVLSLGTAVPGTVKRATVIGGRSSVVTLVDVAPGRRNDYRVFVERPGQTSPTSIALVARQTTSRRPMSPMSADQAGDECQPLIGAISSLNRATYETEVPSRLNALDYAQASQSSSDECPDEAIQWLTMWAGLVRGMTAMTVDVGEVRAGERVIVHVARPGDATESGVAWTVELEAPPRSRWIAAAGLTAAGRSQGLLSAVRIDETRERYGVSLAPIVAGVGLGSAGSALGLGTGVAYRRSLVAATGVLARPGGLQPFAALMVRLTGSESGRPQ